MVSLSLIGVSGVSGTVNDVVVSARVCGHDLNMIKYIGIAVPFSLPLLGVMLQFDTISGLSESSSWFMLLLPEQKLNYTIFEYQTIHTLCSRWSWMPASSFWLDW